MATENDLVVLFGHALQGRAFAVLSQLAEMRAASGQRTRFMALGDYANSRGAADMGLLPGHLPGYASIENRAARQLYGQIWGASLSATPGLDTQQMLEAATTGQLKALWVVGSNPAQRLQRSISERLGKLDFLVVQELFLSDTARLADVVLPALCAYEKDGTMTNTAGEVQLLRKAADCMGPRSDFDILRILSHQLARHGAGNPIRLRTPEAAFAEIRQHVAGYDLSWVSLLAGGAEAARPVPPANGHAPYDVPAGTITSAGDSQFTSGSLSPYCTMIRSLHEADAHS